MKQVIIVFGWKALGAHVARHPYNYPRGAAGGFWTAVQGVSEVGTFMLRKAPGQDEVTLYKVS